MCPVCKRKCLLFKGFAMLYKKEPTEEEMQWLHHPFTTEVEDSQARRNREWGPEEGAVSEGPDGQGAEDKRPEARHGGCRLQGTKERSSL